MPEDDTPGPRRDPVTGASGGSGPSRPTGLVTPPAVQMNARRIVAVGTGLWLVAFVVLLPFWGWLGRHDHRLWLWTCLAGAVLGLLGYALMLRHRHLGRTL